MNNNSGPEFGPLRDFVKEFKILVEIFDKSGSLIRTERMDYGKREDRLWLGKLSFWAWSNGHSVETKSV